MVMADQVQGRPTMVIAMMSAATTQPTAIHKPPNRIQSRLSNSETGDIWFSAGYGSGPMACALRFGPRAAPQAEHDADHDAEQDTRYDRHDGVGREAHLATARI